MGKAHRIRTYRRGDFGANQNLILFSCLMLFLISIGFGSLNNTNSGERFDSLKDSYAVLSEEKKLRLSALALFPDSTVELNGDYSYQVDYGSGKMLNGTIRIGDSKISRTIDIKHYSMFGEANYKVVGSTIQYSDVMGDRYLFPSEGSMLGQDKEYGQYLEIDEGMKLFYETQYSENDYQPLVISNDKSIIQNIKDMTLWSVLQSVFAISGLVILIYVLASMIVDSRKTPNHNLLSA